MRPCPLLGCWPGSDHRRRWPQQPKQGFQAKAPFRRFLVAFLDGRHHGLPPMELGSGAGSRARSSPIASQPFRRSQLVSKALKEAGFTILSRAPIS